MRTPASEFLRIRTIRAQLWLLAAYVVIVAVWSAVTARSATEPGPNYLYEAYLHIPDTALVPMIAGIYAAVEPARESIALSCLIEPRRVRLAVTRLTSAAVIGLCYAVAALVVASVASLVEHHPNADPYRMTEPWGATYHLAWVMLIALPACAITGASAGLLIRSMTGALTTLIPVAGVLLFTPVMFSLTEPKICEFLLGSAVNIAAHTNDTTYGAYPDLPPGAVVYHIGPPPHIGILILAAYVLVLGSLATWAFHRRDAI